MDPGRRFLLLSLTSLVGVSAEANAHPEFPRVASILFEPGKPEHAVLVSNFWGSFVTNDRGETWGLSCAEAQGGESTSMTRPRAAILRGGTTLFAESFHGLQVSTDGLCGFAAHPAFAGGFVEDVAVSRDGAIAYVLTAIAKGTTIDSQLWRSLDGATTFAPLGASPPSDVAPVSLGVAPSDPNVFYIAAQRLTDGGSGGRVLLRSRDAGGTWAVLDAPFSGTSGEWPRIVAIDPKNPSRLFVEEDTTGTYVAGRWPPENLFMSQDGGETWQILYVGTGPLPGFAYAPDGQQIVFGGPLDGMFGADVTALASRGPSAVIPVSTRAVWGLTWTSAGLYAGTDEFVPAGMEGFTVGVSRDGGHTFSPYMSVCGVTALSCEPSSSEAEECAPVRSRFEQTLSMGPRCIPDGGVDVSVTDSGTREPEDRPRRVTVGGCGCTAARSRAMDADALAVALAASWGARRRRSLSSRRRPSSL